MIHHAALRSYDLTTRSRQVRDDDFDNFDLIIAMDESNVRNMQEICGGRKHHAKYFLMTAFCRKFKGASEIPDPYYGGGDGFEEVLDLLEDACDEFINRLDLGEV